MSSAPTLRVNPSWTAFTDYFTSPPALAAGSLSGTWADVEILHTNNIVAWKINGVLINLLTNSFGWTAGSPSIGHADLFASIGSLNNFSVFDNIVVTQFAPTDNPRINKTTRSGSTVVIDFYGGYGSTTPQFKVFGSSTVNGTYSAVTGPVITQISAGFFRATLTENAEIQFYQIVRQ